MRDYNPCEIFSLLLENLALALGFFNGLKTFATRSHITFYKSPFICFTLGNPLSLPDIRIHFDPYCQAGSRLPAFPKGHTRTTWAQGSRESLIDPIGSKIIQSALAYLHCFSILRGGTAHALT